MCFGLESSEIGTARSDNFETDYQNAYKPVMKFLYSHPAFRMSFAFNGVFFQYLKKKHGEFVETLRELTARKQVEVIGGGFYDPVFPLLFPVDRSGQIEMLSSEIRQSVGRRPRGMTLYASCWDFSVLSSARSCGMEYVFLESALVPPEQQKFFPLIMSDRGKSIDILPVHTELKPPPGILCGEYLENVRAAVEKTQKKEDRRLGGGRRVVCVPLSPEDLRQLLQSGWLDSLDRAVAEDSEGAFVLSTPENYRKAEPLRIPAYIAAGIGGETGAALRRRNSRGAAGSPVTVFDFFQNAPQSRALYDRMLYVSLIMSLYHSDKMRKSEVRKKLWQSQSGNAFLDRHRRFSVASACRQRAYQFLVEAERILREYNKFSESLVSFDYNSDGMSEYIFRMQNYFACVSLTGGAVREFDVMRNSGNFADHMRRAAAFDGFDDSYEGGLFVDHLLSGRELAEFTEGRPPASGVFAGIRYEEKRISENGREVRMRASAVYGDGQKVSLLKKYTASSGGFTVQYILKNESGSRLDAKFAVESDLAQTNFRADGFSAFRVEVVAGGRKLETDTRSSSRRLSDSGVISDTEYLQITDTDGMISFVFEPNESCGLFFEPVTFRRPEAASGEPVPICMSFAAVMFWHICLEPGMEMEKTVNFSVAVERKRRIPASGK